MAKVADAHACRRLSMESCLYSAKRASLQSEGLCLVCGRRATGRCSKCSIATFCGPQCQESATHSHSGIVGSQARRYCQHVHEAVIGLCAVHKRLRACETV